MPLFSYKALDKIGNSVSGKLAASSEAELEVKLKQSQLDLVSAKEIKTDGFSLFGGVRQEELILVCSHLYQMEKAGVAILDSLEELRNNADSAAIRNIMMDVYDSLRNGSLLSQALAKYPKVFDSVFIGLIRTGEKTGNLAESFKHLEHHLKWSHSISSRIKKATYYPAFLLAVLIGVLSIMMVYVVPKVTKFLLSRNIELPWYTTLLISVSDFMSIYWPFLLLLPVILFIGVKLAKIFFEPARYYVDLAKLHLPIIGPIILKIELARFCHFFAITYKSGMSVLDCLETSNNVVQNYTIKRSIMQAKIMISEGSGLTEALVRSGSFPSLVIRMFKVGESSGNLDASLKNINDFYDEEINTSIDSLISLLQPILTMIMGGLMGWITVAVFGPIYSSFDKGF
jgi:type IV pilus assembly protein PilC